MALTGKTVAEVYKDLLTVNSSGNNNQGLETTRKTVVDGEGISSGLKLGSDTLEFTGYIHNDMHLYYDVESSTGAMTIVDSENNIKWKMLTAPDGKARVTTNNIYSVKNDASGAMAIYERGTTSSVIKNITAIEMMNSGYNSGASTAAMTMSSSGTIVINQDVETKSAVTFKSAGYDDMTLSAENADFGKSGDKGKMKFEDDTVSMRKGTKDLFTARDDGTTRLQEVTDFPSTNTAVGDMVNKSGTIYINTN